MAQESVPITVHILDKEYRVACAESEREALLASAQHLNNKMKEIRDSGKIVGIERIAVMAALNIAHELLQQRGHKEEYSENVSGKMRALQDKIARALSKSKARQMEF